MATIKQPKSKAQIERNKLIKLVHVAKRELHLDDSTYRAVLKDITGKESSKDCTAPELRKVIDTLKTKGFNITPKQPKPNVVSHNKPMLDKIEALLADGGYPWEYATGIAKNMFQKEDLRFCNGDELRRIIAALAYNKQRNQVKQAKAD